MTKLIIQVDAEVTDPTWTEHELVENSVFFFQSAIDRAEQENNVRFPDPSYTIDTSDITVWTEADYAADKADENAHTTESGNVTFTPWTDGFAVGFKVSNKATGATRYVYLNPSLDDDQGQGGDAGTVFVYEGDGADPSEDGAISHVDVMGELTHRN